MTLALVAWCKNGVALAADSRSSFPDANTSVFRQASDNAEKLFGVGKCGVVTSGFGEFLGRTIYSHIQDFAPAHEDSPPSTIARSLGEFFHDLYEAHIAKYPQQRQQANSSVVEFLVGGDRVPGRGV